MPATPFIQFIYPKIPCYNDVNIGLRINRISSTLYQSLFATYGNGYFGYDPVGTGKITASQSIVLSDIFTIEGLGEYERTMHDISANPVVPKIEITIGDFFFISGESNGASIDTALASFLDELFSDTTAIYEVWLDRWSADGATLEEIWFVGDIDYNTIPMAHRYGALDALSVVAQYPFRQAVLTANMATERFTANVNRTYLQNGVNWVPGSIMEMAYNFMIGSSLAIWQGGIAGGINNSPIYCGSAVWLRGFSGDTGPSDTGIIVGYEWGAVDTNICNIQIAQLAELIALYGGFANGIIDSNMMFDYYSQAFTSTPNILTKQIGIGSGDYSNLYVNANFLFGNGIPVTNSFSGAGIHMVGSSGHGGGHSGFGAPCDIQFATGGSNVFYDYPNTTQATAQLYLGGNIVGSTIWLQTINSSFTDAQEYYGASLSSFTGTVTGSTFIAYGSVAGSPIALTGTISGTTITIDAMGPLLYQWPNTIASTDNVMKLALWIAQITGTWVDVGIDTSGNSSIYWRARRTPLGIYFTGTNLTIPEGQPLESDEGAIDVAQTSLTIQRASDDVIILAGPDRNNAVAITMPPFASHKFGAYTTAGEPFYNPGNDINQCIEQWWDKSQPWGDAQPLSVTCDAKISDGWSSGAFNYDGGGDYTYTAPAGIAIPTSTGWIGGSLLLWHNTGMDIFPDGEYLNSATFVPPQPSTSALYGIAAIVPAGLPLPTDEMCGGYFNPQWAYCQFYYQEMTGNKLVLTQKYAGFLGDDGTIQGLRPGLLIQTLLRGLPRVFKMHSVKQNFIPNPEVVVQYVEVPLDDSGNPNYNGLLPVVTQIGGSGSGSSSAVGAPTGGGVPGGGAGAISWQPNKIVLLTGTGVITIPSTDSAFLATANTITGVNKPASPVAPQTLVLTNKTGADWTTGDFLLANNDSWLLYYDGSSIKSDPTLPEGWNIIGRSS